MIDLNGNEFDGNSGAAIFNKGVAGVVNNCTIKAEKKDPQGHAKAPDWKIVATDETGASTDLSFYYLTDETHQYYEANVKKQGQLLKNLLKAIMGEGVKIPPFATTTEMLDKCMEMVNAKAKGKTFSVFANYGTKNSKAVSSYIKLRTFVPFIATASTVDSLVETPYDTMERPQADKPAASASSVVDAGGAAVTESDWV